VTPKASRTSALRPPLPIAPFSPAFSSGTVYGSIRSDVVGPADPMTAPALRGWPHVVDDVSTQIKR
jgi:hypothetical protein